MPDFLSEEQVLVLKQTHRSLKDKRLADRIKAILYVNYGLTYQEIAKLLMFDETSLSRYVKRFKEKGVELDVVTPEDVVLSRINEDIFLKLNK